MTEQPLSPQPGDAAALLGHVSTGVVSSYATAKPLTPEVVNAIVRDPNCPLYPSQIGVFCDRCGTEVLADYMVSSEQTKSERLEVAREHLRGRGWRCDEDGDICPACSRPVSAAPNPGVTAALILDRLDRGKTPTGMELRSLRSCVADLLRQAANAETVTVIAGPTRRVLDEVYAERAHQDAKWGVQDHRDGTGPQVEILAAWSAASLATVARDNCQRQAEMGIVSWLDVLGEEVAEALAEDDPAKLRAELVQVAAVAAAWVEAIDRRGGA
jgi:hypothetical protein